MSNGILPSTVMVLLSALMTGCATPEGQKLVHDILTPLVTPNPSPPSGQNVVVPIVNFLIKVNEKQLADKTRVEEEMRRKGETVTQAVVRIEDLNVNPSSVVAGSNVIATCRYAAYGPAGNMAVPSGTLRLLRNGVEAKRYPLDIRSTGRSEFTPQNIGLAEDAASGEWQVEVSLNYGTASDTRQCAFQVVDVATPGAPPASIIQPQQDLVSYLGELQTDYSAVAPAIQAASALKGKQPFQISSELDTQIIPAYERFHQSAVRMNPRTDSLRQIHQILVTSLEVRISAQRHLSTAIKKNDASMMRSADAELTSANQTEAQYASDLRTYAASLGVNLR